MTQDQDPLLDHEIDGIRELDNALPRWWLYGFYFTILFSVAYIVNYHVLPTPFLGKSTIAAEYEADVAEAARLRPAGTSPASAVALKTDAESISRGEAIFRGQANACHACHREDLGGLVGPNLTDDFWIHGCSVAEIAKNVATGFPDKGMQAYGTGARLTDAQLTDLISFVVSRHGSAPANAKPIDAARELACALAR